MEFDLPWLGNSSEHETLLTDNQAFTQAKKAIASLWIEELPMKNTVVVFVLLAMGTIPDVLFAGEKTTSDNIQPPVVNLMPGPATLPESVIALTPAMPRGPMMSFKATRPKWTPFPVDLPASFPPLPKPLKETR
jgi:hypothetical protein